MNQQLIHPNIGEERVPASQEKVYSTWNGCCMLFVSILLFPVIIGFIFLLGLFTLQPNEAMVLTLCGKYKGTVKESGYHWVNPFLERRQVSLRSNNLDGEVIKVNDKVGNPIMIAAVVVWRVKNTAKAIFDVNDYFNFVRVQYESAVRNLAIHYAYEKTSEGEISLRSGHQDVTNHLMQELHNRLDKAGIDVEEARITTLSYSAEIAGAMLRRQQADAVIAAREKIVQGAVGIVGHAISSLRDNNIANLSQEERSRLVSNLMVVLCSENSVHPTLNTGS
jgi:regulator of protease activity HflC (stomatin/prohibitin superfamily)